VEVTRRYDVMAVGAHPDDVEVFMGGTVAKLGRMGYSFLLVDLCSGEPARYGRPGERAEQARRAAGILGAERITLDLQDRMIRDTPEARIAVAELIRMHRPRIVFTSEGSGVHPDHAAVTHIVTNGVFYARLPKWDALPGGAALADTEPHEIDRLFFGHCRMEGPWSRFDFAVDVSEFYDVKLAALAAYEAVFGDDQGGLVDRYAAEDRYVGSLVGVRYAEAFKARAPLLVADPAVFSRVRYG
jgi:bacillithiol biosynthesis deacetylase BshB1